MCTPVCVYFRERDSVYTPVCVCVCVCVCVYFRECLPSTYLCVCGSQPHLSVMEEGDMGASLRGPCQRCARLGWHTASLLSGAAWAGMLTQRRRRGMAV